MRSRALIAIASALAVAGCGGASTSTPAAPSATVTNLRGTLPVELYGYMYVGRSYQFAATETLSDGTARTATPAWTSSDLSVVTVDGRGLAQPVWPGTAVITASSGGQTWTYNAMVRPDFAGRWVGTFTVTACAAAIGQRTTSGLCSDALFRTGSTKSITLDLGPPDTTTGTQTGTLTLGAFADRAFKVRPLLATTTMMDLNSYSIQFTSPSFPTWDLARETWGVRLDTKWDLQGDFRIGGWSTGNSAFDRGEFVGRIDHLTRQ